MNIIFLSGLFPDRIRNYIISNSKGNIQYAADNLQWNFIKGLNEFTSKIKCQIINAPLVGSYPLFFKKIFVKGCSYNWSEDIDLLSLRYFNFPFLKQLIIRNNLKKAIRKNIKNSTDENNLIIVYGMLPAWVLAAVKIKRNYPKTKLCLIVPDFPEFMSEYKSLFNKLRRLLAVDLYKYVSNFDYFVLLTDEMVNKLKVKNKPHIIIEGIVDPSEINLEEESKSNIIKVFMYSGTLAKRYGIIDLLDAFNEIEDSNFELWICGEGNTREEIIQRAKIDNRIKYFGLLTREEVLILQRKATILVNPRDSMGEYTKYSFPSKTLEYMLSGTPCIIRRLPGIPVDYYNFTYSIEDNGVRALKDKMIEVGNKDLIDLIKFGNEAQKYVIMNKNYKIQVEKMLSIFKN